MPYGHLIAATVMTLCVCQGHSSIASFCILTSASRLKALRIHAESFVEIEIGKRSCGAFIFQKFVKVSVFEDYVPTHAPILPKSVQRVALAVVWCCGAQTYFS